MTDQERFDKYVDKSGECWTWVGGTTTAKGHTYGIFLLGKSMGAHRAALLLAGIEIPKGRHVHHLCETTLCVRPDHLEVLTPKEHAHKGSQRAALRTHCRQGHPYTDRLTTDGRRRCWVCHAEANARNAARYGKEYFRDAARRYVARKRISSPVNL